MSLRRRVLLGCLTLGLVLGMSLLVIVHRQRVFMTKQLDAQLMGATSFADALALLVTDPEALGLTPVAAAANTGLSLAGVSLAYVAPDGTVTAPSSLAIDDRPDLDGIDLTKLSRDDDTIVSISSQSGDGQFRAILMPAALGGYSVVAMPLDDVERTVDQLLITSLVSSLLVLAVFALIVWSVERIGLRPILTMTRDADAITSGARDRRVQERDPATEVGRLGRAFNRVLDERDAADERLRRFVADASHELRTPITSLRGYLDLSIDGDLDDLDADELLARMRRETRRMSDLVEDLLLLANLDSGRPMRSDPVDLAVVVHDAAADAMMLQPDRPITVDVPATPVVVTGDHVRIEQVFAGLVHNALVHTPPTARIHLSVRVDGDEVTAVVADTGPGIEPELVDRVFDRFVRGDPSRSRHVASSGLGLSIAKSIVEALGGRLELRSDPGRGCAFSVVLSMATVPAWAGEPASSSLQRS